MCSRCEQSRQVQAVQGCHLNLCVCTVVLHHHLSGLWGCLKLHCSGVVPLSVKWSCVQLLMKLHTSKVKSFRIFWKSIENPSSYSSLFLLSHGSSCVGHWIILPLMGRVAGKRAGVPGWIQILLDHYLVYPVSTDRPLPPPNPVLVTQNYSSLVIYRDQLLTLAVTAASDVLLLGHVDISDLQTDQNSTNRLSFPSADCWNLTILHFPLQ